MCEQPAGMVSITESVPVVMARIHGELTNATCDHVYREINRAIHHDTMGVVLDLADIVYIDSTGLATLIKIGLENRSRIVRPSTKVRQLLDLTKVNDCISISKNAHEAKRELTAPNSDA